MSHMRHTPHCVVYKVVSGSNFQNEMQRSRAFVFTWNNYPDDHADILDALDARYHCYGNEVAPTTGTLHLQGYLYFKHARSVTGIRSALPGVHVEVAKGTPDQAITYCKKEGSFVEFGNGNKLI